MENRVKRLGMMQLWHRCFGDSDEFIHWYFDHKYLEDNSLAFIDDAGNVISALQMLPYAMTFAGTQISTSYISGACTLPEFRNRGIMSRLLKDALMLGKKRGVAVSILIPQEEWLYDYYGKLGYSAVFACSLKEYVIQESMDVAAINVERCGANSDALIAYFDYFTARTRERSCCVQHDWEDFRMVLEDIERNQGVFLVARNLKMAICGMVFGQVIAGKVLVDDWFYDSEEVRVALLQAIGREQNVDRVSVRELSEAANCQRRGMLRLIDIPEILNRYAAFYPQKSFVLQLEDVILPQNTGVYTLDSGQCVVGKALNEALPFLNLSLEELTQLLFTGLQEPPFLSLMLD